MYNHSEEVQSQKSDNQQLTNTGMPLNKRNAKDIQKMIQKLKDSQETSGQIQVPYEEACEHYKYYKSRTLKANVNEPDFK